MGQLPWYQKDDHLKWTNGWHRKGLQKTSQLKPYLKPSAASHFTYNNDWGSRPGLQPLPPVALVHWPYLAPVSPHQPQQPSVHTSNTPSSLWSQGPFEKLGTLYLTFKQPNFSSSLRSQFKQPFGEIFPDTTHYGWWFKLYIWGIWLKYYSEMGEGAPKLKKVCPSLDIFKSPLKQNNSGIYSM